MDESRVNELANKIIKARSEYYSGNPTVSDAVFDAWIDELKLLDPSNSAVTNIGSIVVSSEWEKANHKIPMGSLDKVNTPEEISAWINDRCKDSVFVTEKLDGLSIELVYEDGKFIQAITRGDGITGEDVTANVKRMNGVPNKLTDDFTGSIRGEILLRRSKHKKHFPDKANPRNAAVGITKRLDGVGSEHLDVFSYQIIGETDYKTEAFQFKYIKSLGFQTPQFAMMVGNVSEKSKFIVDKWNEYQTSLRDSLDYDIDGLVVRVNDLEKQSALGDKDLRPKGAVAFKFASEMRESEITGITWQVGNSGRITPVAHIKPIQLMGAVITNASIYNIAYINKLGIDIGATVLVCRANDVIPRIEEVVKDTNTVAQPPDTCPTCGHKTKLEGENLICPNTDLCQTQVIGRIKTWISTLNILEWGDTLVERTVTTGLVKTVADLYTLKTDDLETIERMGKKSAKKCYDILWQNNPVVLELFLGGLAIPMVAVSTIKMVMSTGYDSLEKIRNMTKAEIENVPGLGPVKAESLYNSLLKNKDLIDLILKNGVVIKDKVDGKLTGMSFCFTGAMNNKRPVLEKMVIDNGGEAKSSVGKGLTYLVIADVNSTASKAVSARKLGTKLVSEEEFLEMIK